LGKMTINEVILHPLISEDAITLIEAENKITFVVNINADKNDIKRAVRELYDVNVAEVNTCITSDGRKKAYVKLVAESKAADLAVKLGVL
jgi:large subunit ribosomal protein L23